MSSTNHKNNANRRIDEELVSVDSLINVLSTCCGCKSVKIDREQNDPPDFTVIVEGEPFPTEVTSIVSRQQYHAQIDEFVKAIQNRSVSLGILSGKYAFIVSRLPIIPKPKSNYGIQLIDAAIDYIDSTRERGTCPKLKLAQDETGTISIEKVSDNGSNIGTVWIPPAMWEGEIQSQLAKLIQHAVDNKRRKLCNAGINSRKSLLLLYDAFGNAEPKDAIAAMKAVNGYDRFHSIFWVASFSNRKNTLYPEEPGREGLFLFSNNPSWHKVGTV